jgi:N-methylhydantoinase B
MSSTLIRTAHNPLLFEAKDFSTGIVSAEGLLWAEGEDGITTFLGGLPDTVKTGLAKHGHDGFAEGDILIANDPYLTGTHLSDVTVYVPVFVGGDLVAFAATTAHWADVGGKTPGGWCPDSTDIYQEGICFSHQKLVAAGTANEAVWELIEANVRFPSLVRGDLEAQIAACRQGVARVHALCEKYGVPAVRRAMEFAIARTDEAMRARIAALPQGTYRGTTYLDSDGVTPDQPLSLCLTLAVEGDRIRVSFQGTSATTRGPVNDPVIGTRSDLRAAIKGLLAPMEPANEGHFLAIDFDFPPGLVVSPARPAPCDSFGWVGIAFVHLVFRILAEALPDRCPAGGWQLFSIYLFREDPRDGPPFILFDTAQGGDGGRPFADGPTLTFVTNGDVHNTPIEVMETRYPVRVERYRLRPSVAGPGQYRGGFGAVRDYRILEDGVYMQVAIENVRHPTARGIHGGRDGGPSVVVAWPGTAKERRIEWRASFFGPFEPGDIVSVRTGGGGGWGDVLDRAPELVARDVRNEVLTQEEAAEVYGVVFELSPRGVLEIDSRATTKRREELREGD